MEHTKYVIINYDGFEVPIIFSSLIQHDCFRNLQPISAGFVTLTGADKPDENACICANALDVYAYGESVSLKLKSREQDTAIIKKELMRHYN